MIDKKRFIVAVLAGVLTIAGVSSVFAAEPSTHQPVKDRHTFFNLDRAELSDKIKSAIDSLVKAGTITEAQADAVKKAYTPENGSKLLPKHRISPMSKLVEAGTITQAQADAVSSALSSGLRSGKSVEDILKGLVTDGTVTEAQKEAIQKVYPGKNIHIRPAVKNSLSLDKLVEAGTITQAQADAFTSAIKSARKGRKSVADIVKDLVEAGTITQTQADAFNSALKSLREAVKSPVEVLKDMVSAGTITQAQADEIKKITAPFADRDFSVGIKNRPLDELVKAGTITQAQADAINDAIKEALGSLKK